MDSSAWRSTAARCSTLARSGARRGRTVGDRRWRHVGAERGHRPDPQLALHLDRAVNDKGLKLDKQRHTAPLWVVGDQEGSVLDHLAALVGIAAGDVLAFDLTIFDTAPPVIFGASAEFWPRGGWTTWSVCTPA